MPRNSRPPVTGKHRVARRTKIAMGAIGLAIAVGGLAVAVTAGRTGEASADPADPSFFIDINKVPAGNNVNAALKKKGAQGSFTVNCGTDADGGHQNPDNFIAQPGIKNGAQHLHDYVGNLTTNADSSLKSLLAGGTTCKNGDKSAYFWPVIRVDRGDKEAAQQKNQKAQQQQKGKTGDVQQDKTAQDAQDAQEQRNSQGQGGGGRSGKSAQQQGDQNQNGQQQQRQRNQDQQQNQQDQNKQGQNKNQNQNNQDKANQDKANQDKANQNQAGQAQQAADLGGIQGANKEVGDNDGTIIEPESATLKFIGGGADNVVAMPLGLKILYGDAKQSTNGPANARPSWTCTGFEDRLTDLYPICPAGSKVERIHAFPNCWDGKNTDSANHRTHIVFANQQGKCPQGFKNVPQLQVTLVYNVPQDVQQNGEYKVDAFAQEKHNPRSDHDDFANVMSKQIMGRLVNCVNSGKACAE
ncbi:hypothetical protein AMES_2515 [Amycolatopsis mediterranei S699]|uniref:DUF1996 domain-containing protein n=1 Tax=Amycolatopsis mediterranei (strain U-32) TaxID=749927 RepID=A0A0H3D497_AMYMU|nr:DUF1996 domain-containing protein [Amycolatopsis mediterranei]ADJ44338.1 conserved hypothetical protein [Amycolatopsis mediterranei U32]AFO76051.1 hypothetical protein AMES_2515 [Amycolatopsis mediterranei S699]AGT83180.1 hypothetical protein B737_2516 [Amycolatopsis mediterranei RB]KDO06745.1 hypothetical protein DV26_31605 [Amycolatopsis mediterranei]KDU92345.1 hypothetical protein DV36_10450 [Amycolatopsis mediterranei]